MTNQSIIDKLIEMRLTTMADAFRNVHEYYSDRDKRISG